MTSKVEHGFFDKFLITWGTRLEIVPHILKYLDSYPDTTKIMSNFVPADDIYKTQFEWIRLLNMLEDPIDTNFFKEYWVPLSKYRYDYFIDLSSPDLKVFEIDYFGFEPYSWVISPIFENASNFLLNFDNPSFDVSLFSENVKKAKWKEYTRFFDIKDSLGFSDKICPEEIDNNDAFVDIKSSKLIHENNSIAFTFVNSIIIGLLFSLDSLIFLNTFISPFFRHEGINCKIKNIKSLIYLLQSSGYKSVLYYTCIIELEQKVKVIFYNDTIKFECENQRYLNHITRKYEKLKSLN
ncbi:MAG: hypothetical protein PHW82_05630 [Bacteroidales bacterium]|nr:hypothetical protein [Bacteroidales bacterium]